MAQSDTSLQVSLFPGRSSSSSSSPPMQMPIPPAPAPSIVRIFFCEHYQNRASDYDFSFGITPRTEIRFRWSFPAECTLWDLSEIVSRHVPLGQDPAARFIWRIVQPPADASADADTQHDSPAPVAFREVGRTYRALSSAEAQPSGGPQGALSLGEVGWVDGQLLDVSIDVHDSHNRGRTATTTRKKS